jgi:hypothetical protein
MFLVSDKWFNILVTVHQFGGHIRQQLFATRRGAVCSFGWWLMAGADLF